MKSKFFCSKPYHLLPIRAMQTYLRYISRHIPEVQSVIPDGIYGVETENSVSSFQKYFDLPENGIIDYETWEMIFFVYHQLQEFNKL